jgi:hypothetical protein
MEITIGLYGKGNEIIFWSSFCVGLCLVVSNNSRYMWHYCQSMMHQIWRSQINNDNVHYGSKIIFGDDNIHSFSSVAKENVKFFFYLWVPLFDVIATMVFWSVSWVVVCSFPHRQCNKWIPNSSMVWPHLHRENCCNCKMWYIQTNMECY